MPAPHLHHLSFGPEDLPPTTPIDLRKAWRAAHVAAEVGLVMEPGDVEGVSFRHKNGAESRFIFADLDAACWAAAIDRTYDLQTTTGVSLLFRLLALIDLMASAPWLRPYFSLTEKDGATLAPLLLAAAASEPLSRAAAFDAASFKAAMGLSDLRLAPAPVKQSPGKQKAKPKPKAAKPKGPRQKPPKAKAGRKKK